jgi:DNA polymerase-3 subunit delta'
VNPESAVSASSEEKKQSKYIRIDQVRDILSVNELSSYRGGMRVILIYPVESMRIEAANCLLKSLEEPADKVFYILVTHRLESILPTIRSRCRLLALPKPSQELSIPWLAEQAPLSNKSHSELEALFLEMGRSPLKVLNAMEGKSFNSTFMLNELSSSSSLDHSKLIDLLSRAELSDLLSCLQKWCIDLYMVYSGVMPRYFPDKQLILQEKVKKVNILGLNQFLKLLIEELKLTTHPLFPKVQLESVLSKYSQLFKS